MEIEGIVLDLDHHYLDPVTYVPDHAKGNAQHPDAEIGVIIGLGKQIVKVLYCKGRTVQGTSPKNLVWG